MEMLSGRQQQTCGSFSGSFSMSRQACSPLRKHKHGHRSRADRSRRSLAIVHTHPFRRLTVKMRVAYCSYRPDVRQEQMLHEPAACAQHRDPLV